MRAKRASRAKRATRAKRANAHTGTNRGPRMRRHLGQRAHPHPGSRHAGSPFVNIKIKEGRSLPGRGAEPPPPDPPRRARRARSVLGHATSFDARHITPAPVHVALSFFFILIIINKNNRVVFCKGIPLGKMPIFCLKKDTFKRYFFHRGGGSRF